MMDRLETTLLCQMQRFSCLFALFPPVKCQGVGMTDSLSVASGHVMVSNTLFGLVGGVVEGNKLTRCTGSSDVQDSVSTDVDD